MKCVKILFASMLLSSSLMAGETNDLVITRGNRIGETVKGVKRERIPNLVVPSQTSPVISLTARGNQPTNAVVELQAFRHEVMRAKKDGKKWPLACYEFQILSKQPGAFEWCCWVGDFPRPHRFQVFTPANSYAVYVASGVQIYRLTKSRSPEAMREVFHSAENHPDALPCLPITLLFDTVGRYGLLGLGPQTWNITVDSLSETAGELRITLHGEKPEPKYIYAL